MVIEIKKVIPVNPLAAPQPAPVEQQPRPPAPKPIAAKKEPKPAQSIKRPRGRPQSGKETVTLRLSAKVVEHFKPLGKGWKQAIDAYLVESLKL